MSPNDFVFNQIYKGALAKKATERAAHNAALNGLEFYKKHKISKKVSGLIAENIAAAVKASK